MDLLRLGLGTALAWLLFAVVFAPLFRRRAAAAGLPLRPRRLAMAAVLETIGGIAFWLTVSVLLAFGLVEYLTKLVPNTADEAQQTLDLVNQVVAWVATASRNWSVAASCLALFALVVWSYRRVKRVETKRISDAIGAEITEVAREAGAGTLSAAPGPIQQSMRGAIAERRAALGQVETAVAAGSTDPQNPAKIAALKAEIAKLEQTAAEATIMETAYDRVSRRTREKDAAKRWSLATFVASEGMLTTMSAGLKVLSILVLLLSVPASLVVTGPIAAERLYDQNEKLVEDLRNFRLVAELSGAEEAFQAALVAEPAQEQATELSAEDMEAADGLARIFESDVAPNAWNPTIARVPVEVALRTQANNVREIILARQASRYSGLAIQSAVAPEAGFAREADALLRQSSSGRGPTTEVGRLAANENRRLAVERPQMWARVRSGYQSYMSSFGRLAPPAQIRGLAVSQAIGETFSSVSGASDSFFGQQLRNAGGSISSDTAKAYVQATHHRFVAEIARGSDVVTASERAAHIGQFVAAPNQSSALRYVATLTPENARLAETSARSALYVAERGDAARVGPAVQRVARTVGTNASAELADAVASFEDYFPGSQGDEQRSRRANVAREANLHGAPPSPGTETSSYTRRSRSMATRAVSFRSLRGFARVGGVLIGREPEDGSIAVQNFSWRLDADGFSFDIEAATGIMQHFGPYRPSIANLALAYAADGRPTTVTMVSATPLVELKILTHPTLVDTAIGCRARRLDQFADEMTSEDETLRTERSAAEIAARSEIALYSYARAVRISDYASSPENAARLSELGGDGLVAAAEQILSNPNVIAESQSALGRSEPLAIAMKPQFFEARLVETVNTCRNNLGIEDFANCLRLTFVGERASAIDERLDWLAPAPTYQIWSGVRELPYSVTPDFEFLRASGDPLSPFSFMVQVAIDSPAFFAGSAAEIARRIESEPGITAAEKEQLTAMLTTAPANAARWYSEDNPEIDEYVDPDPWEFTSLAPTLNQTVAAGVAADFERTSVFNDMRDFAFLQRFFRVALDGRLGPGFPLDDLVKIDEETASAVDRSVPTLRWNVRPGLIERSFYGEIEQNFVDPGAAACRALIEQADASGGGFAIAAIDQSTWESVCGAAAFAGSETATRAEQVAAIRELRESLGVRGDDALVVSQSQCPAP